MSENIKLSPENIIEHLMNNVEGLHGLEIELLEMIKQYGVDIYKQGWNDCIDEQTTQKL